MESNHMENNQNNVAVSSQCRLNTLATPRVEGILKTFREHVDNEDGVCPVEYFCDDEIYQLELERVFAKSWVFVGHVSEIPEKGDYLRRPIAEDDFILVRDEQGKIRLLLNVCPHKGADISRAERGNAAHFRCPYHSWAFKNTGERVGAPFEKIAYKEMDNRNWSLLQAPRVEVFYGLIFANLDGNAPSLRDYLGDLAWYLDTVFNLHEDGIEVLGSPQRFVIPADWKTGAENFSGDNYHAPQLHRSIQEIGLANYKGHSQGSRIFAAGAGSGICASSDFIKGALKGEVGSFLRQMYQLERLDEEQRRLHEESPVIIFNAFPNLAFSRVGAAPYPGAPRLPIDTLRSWRPLGPGKMEMWSYHIVWKALPEKYKEAIRKAARVTFGSAGLIEQDDTMAWPGASRAGRSIFARKQGMNFNYQLATPGMSNSEPVADWPGPGVGYSNGLCEIGHRNFHELWLQAMESEAEAPFSPQTDYERFRRALV